MRCVNCQNDVNLGGLVCPYCHGNPVIFGSGPYFPDLSGGAGLFDGLVEGIGGLASRIGRWKRNETNYVDFVFGYTGPGEAVYRRRCSNCATVNWPNVSTCQRCKKTFVK